MISDDTLKNKILPLQRSIYLREIEFYNEITEMKEQLRKIIKRERVLNDLYTCTYNDLLTLLDMNYAIAHGISAEY